MSIWKTFSALTFAATALMAATGHADAASGAGGVPVGWNTIGVSSCVQYNYEGFTYLYIYPTSGGYYWTNEPTIITLMAGACDFGEPVSMYATGGVWYYTYYFPS